MFSEKYIERFHSRYTKRADGCWLFEPTKAGRYGRISMGRGRYVSAHRMSYIIKFGDAPKGMYVCHKCDVTKCVNPDHLYAGTALDNNRDRSVRGRDFNGSKTECKNGHALVDGNYYFQKKRGVRYCLECRRINDKNRTRNTDDSAHIKYLEEHRDRYAEKKHTPEHRKYLDSLLGSYARRKKDPEAFKKYRYAQNANRRERRRLAKDRSTAP